MTGPGTAPGASEQRRATGQRAHAAGLTAEAAAEAALVAEGWTILARRARTPAGEIDLIAEREGLLAFIEVKRRASLAAAAAALSLRQRARLLAAAEIVLAENPGWGRAGVRFDVMLVDPAQRLRRIADAFRLEG
jgi:putative endonuclease